MMTKFLILASLMLYFSTSLFSSQVKIIVGFVNNDQNEIKKIEERFNLKRINFSKNLPIGYYSTNELVDEKIIEVEKDPYVRYAEKNTPSTKNQTSNEYSNQYYLNNYGQSGGTSGIDINWLKTVEYRNKFPLTSEIIVAVIDDGLYWGSRSAFDATVLAFNDNDFPLNGLDDDGNGFIDDFLGWDFSQNDNQVFPEDISLDHGTMVASLITTSQEYQGFESIADGNNIKILPIKIYGVDENGTETYGSAAEAFEYAYEMGAKIINFSSVGPFRQSVRDIVDFLDTQGVLIVCSSGNDNVNLIRDDYEYAYPSSYPNNNIISVGGIDHNGNPYYTSELGGANYGSGIVDVVAPAENIYVYNPLDISFNLENTKIDFDLSDISFWTTGNPPDNQSSINWAISNDNIYGYWLHSGTFQSSPVNSDMNYENHTNTYIKSGWMNLNEAFNNELEFSLYGELETNYDYLYIEVTTDDVTFTEISSFSGNFIPSSIKKLDLSSYDGMKIKIRFRLKTDYSETREGVRIQNIKINGKSNNRYASGTSFSAPIVSGICALIMSLNPELTPSEIRNILIKTSDKLPLFSKNGIYDSYFDQNANGVMDIVYDDVNSDIIIYDERDGGEQFVDALNGIWDEGEAFVDIGNGIYDPGETFTDAINGAYDFGEAYADTNKNGQYDVGEPFLDALNGVWDEGEVFVDLGNGIYDIGESFTDSTNGIYDAGEDFIDEAKVISGGMINGFRALHYIYNKSLLYESNDLENWSFKEDALSLINYSGNNNINSIENWKIDLELNENNERLLNLKGLVEGNWVNFTTLNLEDDNFTSKNSKKAFYIISY